WWPHRQEIDLPTFAAGRRLEDLAYGAGLWLGALRARNGRALLPASPPPVTPSKKPQVTPRSDDHKG
ncbi:MAG: putative glycosyl transferase, partial [Modestobacter sp.]|nr:putative glycosyl transferase [Modestobacter sp.]